ncbi:hypothetical protein [Nostoc sp. FACHB-190]|uniref:hypothetical protein n=1 Tax=Nostoc sp. FACHB-190 TaxID=2692838 RepID=UPI001F5548D2|nr:hypothetical protein [Nostoc sp. FACHB-190]
MTRPHLLQEGQSYTFRSYFEMPYEADEILAELGYSLLKTRMELPRSDRNLERLPELQQRIDESLPLVQQGGNKQTIKEPKLCPYKSTEKV